MLVQSVILFSNFVLSDFVASAFTGKCSSHIAQVPGGKGRDWENDEPPTVGAGKV